MRDFLAWYNNTDVGAFLEAIAKQFDFYKQRHRYVQRRNKRRRFDFIVPLQRFTAEDVFYTFQ